MESVNIFILFYAILLLTSCEQENPDPKNSFIGKNYDEKLLGKWKRKSIYKDFHNSMTLVTDLIHFQHTNRGSWAIFHFNELQEQRNFTFHTEQDSLFLQFENNLQRWTYMIKGDTLIMKSYIPDSLEYLDSNFFTSRFNKD